MTAGTRSKRLTLAIVMSALSAAALIGGCASSPSSAAPTPGSAAAPAATAAAPSSAATAPAAASTAAAAPAVRKPSGTLIVQQPSLRNVPMLPQLGGSGLNVYNNLVFDYLTMLQRDEATGAFKSGPGLATRWDISPDLRTWTFYLRQGIQWQDGYGEFTAEDVKNAIDNVTNNPKTVNPNTDQAMVRRVVGSVEVNDPYKVTFHLTGPFGTLDSLLSNLWLSAPISKKYLDTVGFEAANKKPVGTGPYKFVQLKVGESLTVEAVDQHWRQVPYYKTIVFKEVAEPSTAVAMLKTGDADIIVAPITMRDEIVAAGFQARINPQTEYTYALFSGLWDQTLFPKEVDPKTPWRDVRVREALNIALNRVEIAKTLYKGEAQPASVVLFMPGTIGYNPDLKPYPYDPARAKKLLADAGYPNGFEFNMYIYPWTHAPEIPDLGQVLGQYWSKIGVNAKISWSDYTTVTSIYSSKKDPRTLNPFGYTRMEAPELHIDAFFNPKGRFGIAAPDITQAAQQMEGEPDLAKKDAIGRQIAQKIYDNYWLVPVAWSSMPFYVNPKKVGDWPFLKGEPYMMRLEYLKHPGDQ